jgi:hypothetical protein
MTKDEDQKVASTSEVAKALNVSVPRVHNLLKQGRIIGAFQVGDKTRGIWLIPVDEDGKPEVLPSTTRKRKFEKIT